MSESYLISVPQGDALMVAIESAVVEIRSIKGESIHKERALKVLASATEAVRKQQAEQLELRHFISKARAIHAVDGSVEIDDTALVSDARDSEGGDAGVYVQAWVWISVEGDESEK